MYNYQVTGYSDESNEVLTIKVRTFDRGRKEGFIIKLTEEFIRKNLFSIGEGEIYPQVKP